MLVDFRRGGGDPDLTRAFRSFQYKGAAYRIAGPRFSAITAQIVALRRQIERHIERQPEFGFSFVPVPVAADAPPIVRAMARAAELTGVGPMAAVAGAIAQLAAAAATFVAEAPSAADPPVAQPRTDTIVDNGGDLYLDLSEEAVVGVYPGDSDGLPPLALRIGAELTPLAVCSSSSRMGHSTSLGACDLATVMSGDGALADAAATAACNSVRQVRDMEPTLERIGSIPGVTGVMIVNGGRVGLFGSVPPLERVRDPAMWRRIAGTG